MSVGWSSLPLLPLGCVLRHLSLDDALAAMSTCRHWRSGLLMFEGRTETLKIYAKELEKSLFLTQVFKKHVQALQVHIADCTEVELEVFMHRVLPQYFDTLNLRELIFIGPGCVQQGAHGPSEVKLDRIIVESLIFKHAHCIQKLALIDCKMDTANDSSVNKGQASHENVEFYSKALQFDTTSSPGDYVLSENTADMMMFSGLQHIIADYELINNDTLETLSHLTMFSHLTLMVCDKNTVSHRVDWCRLQPLYPHGLDVSVNIISLPVKKFDDVIENVLVEGLTLTSLKVIYCKTLYAPLLKHIVRMHKNTLRELVWADSPHEGACQRVIRSPRHVQYETCNVNPFILLCWQCTRLRRLVIHGYWMWQYDILGFVRLRKSLERLEISAIYARQRRFPHSADLSGENMARVLAGDVYDSVEPNFIKEVNEYTEFKWKPTTWCAMPGGLRPRASPAQRADYVLQEARRPLGIML